MVHDAGFRQRVVLQIRREAFPIERGFLAPPIDPLKDQLFGHIMVALNSSAITADTIVLTVTSQLMIDFTGL